MELKHSEIKCYDFYAESIVLGLNLLKMYLQILICNF